MGAGAAGNRAGRHGGAAAATPGAGGGGLHGEESGEGESPEDAGSGAGADPGWRGAGASTARDFLPPSAAASGSFRTAASQPADPGRAVPAVVAASLEALVTLRTGASAERMKSVRLSHAQGRLPPRPGGGGGVPSPGLRSPLE